MCYANLNSQLGNDSVSYHFRLSFIWRNWIFFFNLQFQELPFYELAIMCGLGAYWSVRGKKCSKMALKDNFEIFKSRTNKKWMNATASCQNSTIFFQKYHFLYQSDCEGIMKECSNDNSNFDSKNVSWMIFFL